MFTSIGQISGSAGWIGTARRSFRWIKNILSLFLLFAFSFTAAAMKAKPLVSTERYEAGITGYFRTGIGASEAGTTQAAFQLPGPNNTYTFGNQPDHLLELEFDYTWFFDRELGKSLDLVWMISGWAAQDDLENIDVDENEQLYLKANNLFGNEIDLWFGNRYYERIDIHMLDRFWSNPGQEGTGLGVEGLLNKGTDEDLKVALFTFEDDDVISYVNGREADLRSYKLDVRWVHIPVNDHLALNLNANYTFRPENSRLDYDGEHGFGLASWLDYEKGDIKDTVAVLYSQGADLTINGWTGVPAKENPDNDGVVRNDLDDAYSIEINNNFLYDNKETWAFNGICLMEFRDYGTAPHAFGTPAAAGTGDKLLWLSLGGRGMYYVSDTFRLVLELTGDYVDNQQEDVSGQLTKVTFSPEFALAKGYYSRPALRPFITYARWSSELEGFVGTGPGDAPYGSRTDGVTVGIQFEVWW